MENHPKFDQKLAQIGSKIDSKWVQDRARNASGWLAGWPVAGWLAGWLTGWLISYLAGWRGGAGGEGIRVEGGNTRGLGLWGKERLGAPV